jgi:hydroxypyruvate isomerase
MEGDLAHRVRALAGHYPHVQIAGNPGRHEPDIGEINYPFLFDLLDEIGYSGWIGCEYRPESETTAGLGWARRYGIRA